MKSSFYISGVIVSYGIIDVFNENCMHLLILNVSCLITELILIDIYTLTLIIVIIIIIILLWG